MLSNFRNVNLNATDDPVNMEIIASDPRAEGYSGADLAALVREAGLAVIREWRATQNNNTDPTAIDTMSTTICGRHFESAFGKMRSSVSLQDRKR